MSAWNYLTTWKSVKPTTLRSSCCKSYILGHMLRRPMPFSGASCNSKLTGWANAECISSWASWPNKDCGFGVASAEAYRDEMIPDGLIDGFTSKVIPSKTFRKLRVFYWERVPSNKLIRFSATRCTDLWCLSGLWLSDLVGCVSESSLAKFFHGKGTSCYIRYK